MVDFKLIQDNLFLIYDKFRDANQHARLANILYILITPILMRSFDKSLIAEQHAFYYHPHFSCLHYDIYHSHQMFFLL